MSNTLTGAYQHWMSVRARLDHTIQDYVDACATLGAEISRTPLSGSAQLTLSSLDNDLPNLPLDHARLSQANTSLARSRNRSKNCAPINQLPLEILSQVFQAAAHRCVDDRYGLRTPSVVFPDVLAGVCSLWRDLAISMPSLWSHLDLVAHHSGSSNYYGSARIRAFRAKHTPLHVHLVEAADVPATDSEGITKLIEFLTPLAKQISSLKISILDPYLYLIDRVLVCWAQFGTPGTARTLDIRPGEDSCFASLEPWCSSSGDVLGNLSFEQYDEFYRSLRVLNLSGVQVPRTVLAYQGLTELRLDNIGSNGDVFTQSQLAAALHSSPELRVLKLRDAHLRPDGIMANPVFLQYLEELSLRGRESEDLEAVFPLIILGSLPLKLVVTLGNSPTFIAAAHSFFSRSVVKTLHVEILEHYNWFSSFPEQMQHLEYLLLESCSFLDLNLQKYLHIGGPPYWWPQLRELHLYSCDLEPDPVVGLVSKLTIHTLRLYSCTLYNQENQIIQPLENIDELTLMLRDVVPNTLLSWEREDVPLDDWP